MKRKKLNQVIQKFFVLIMAFFISLSSVVTPVTFAEGNQPVAGLLSLDNVTIDSFDIIDSANSDAKIEYKKQGDGDYNSYLTDPSKFGTVLCQNQKNSQLSLKMGIRYRGEEAIKEGDKLEIPAYLGVELKNASFALQPLRDVSGHEIGTYTYNQGNFKLSFSGDYIKNNSVKEVASTLTIGIVSVPNTTQGEGEDIEITPIYGKLGNETIIAGYEKKKRENPTGPGALSLDSVKIKSFKIIDTTHGDAEIDYRTNNSSEYDEYRKDPMKFANTIAEDEKVSQLRYELAIEYNGDTPIIEDDTLDIPMRVYGLGKNFSELPLFDGTKNQIGTWEYKDGNVKIKFAGDYIKNQQVKQFTASFKTGLLGGYTDQMGRTFKKGERAVVYGHLGKNELVTSWQKKHVETNKIGDSVTAFEKSSSIGSDKKIEWFFSLFTDTKEFKGKAYYNPFLLENNGKYTSHFLTDVYVEDTFTDVISAPDLATESTVLVSGITDSGEVVSGWYSVNLPSSLFTKINQETKNKEEVKQSLKDGEYCVYDNNDGTYTFMLKLWDTNDSNGLTYDQLPSIKKAGGVGNYLKTRYSDVYGKLSDETITKINNIYRGKAVQNLRIYVDANYSVVREVKKIPNTVKIFSKQGTYERRAIGTLVPPAGIAEAPADPLSIKLIKSDRKTGEMLSEGFKFELQTSTDGKTWKAVNLEKANVEMGTLNADKTLTPNDKGILQLKGLKVGKYRFIEKAHPTGYMDVAIDEANPNSTKYPKSANSKVIELNNQGTGKVVAMYNEPNAEKIEIKVTKTWVGPEKDSVTVKLLADGKEVSGKTLVLNKAGNWEGKFTNLNKYNINGGEINYSVKEEKIEGYDVSTTGNAKTGFIITNRKETPPTEPKKEVFKGSETTNIDGNQVKPGEILTYKVTYKNITGKAQKVVIEDKIPEFTEYVDNSADNGGVYSGGTITWTKEKVSNGETFEVTFKVKVKESAGGENLKNEALVKAGKNDLKTNPTNNPVPETPPTPPKKEVFKGSETTNIDGKQVNPGEILTYKITYKNTTGKEQKVVIEDKIPEFTEYVNNSADNGGIYSGGTITWTKEKVSNGETFEVTFKVKVKESAGGENLKNEALVKAGKNDLKTNPTNNPVPETPPTKPKKEVFKGSTTTNIDGKEVKSGEILTYKITYKNITGKVQKVVIEDKIPEFTEYVDNSADNGGVYSGGKITWTKASLGNGETYEVTFKVKVKESAGGEKLTNEALVKAGKNDLKTNPTSNPVPETPPTKPKKEVFKGTETTNIDGKQVNPGDILTYKITYKNTTGKVQKVVIEDKIPEFTEYVDNSADNGGVYSNGTITWTKENLGNGETFEVTFKVKVKESASGENIKNEALVKTGNNNLKTNTTNNPVPETPTKPKKEVFKGDTTTNIDGKQVNPGDILTYKITYKNTTRKEQDVVITDKIPTHTAYIENSADNSGVYKDGIITWKKKLLAGESMTVSFKVKVNNNIDGVTLKNMAKVNDGKNDYETNETHNPTPEKTVPNKPTTPNTPDDIIKRLPKTGDGLDPARYAGLFAIPGSILLFFELRRRKNLNK